MISTRILHLTFLLLFQHRISFELFLNYREPRDTKELPGCLRDHVMIYRAAVYLDVGETATMLAFVSGRDWIGLQRVAKDLSNYIASRWDFEYSSVGRGRQRKRERCAVGWDPSVECFPYAAIEYATGTRRGCLAGPTTRRLAASARFFLDPRARIKLSASSVWCQEIYLRRRYYVFGRPRPAANNSLIYFLFALIDRLHRFTSFDSYIRRLHNEPLFGEYLREIYAIQHFKH